MRVSSVRGAASPGKPGAACPEVCEEGNNICMEPIPKETLTNTKSVLQNTKNH